MERYRSVRIAWFVALVALAGGLRSAEGQGKQLPDLNQKVLKFAEDHMGQQVGNGECWTLAAEALSSAGAARPGAKGVGVYDFGHKLEAGEGLLPGDVVQFEKAKFNFPALAHQTAVLVEMEALLVNNTRSFERDPADDLVYTDTFIAWLKAHPAVTPMSVKVPSLLLW